MPYFNTIHFWGITCIPLVLLVMVNLYTPFPCFLDLSLLKNENFINIIIAIMFKIIKNQAFFVKSCYLCILTRFSSSYVATIIF